jgi:hypothetical protein
MPLVKQLYNSQTLEFGKYREDLPAGCVPVWIILLCSVAVFRYQAMKRVAHVALDADCSSHYNYSRPVPRAEYVRVFKQVDVEQ